MPNTSRLRLKHLHLPASKLMSAITHSEALYEDETFPERELAALLTAKVYYHLGEYNESMVFALGAGKLFDLDNKGEFEETIICRSCPKQLITDAEGISSWSGFFLLFSH